MKKVDNISTILSQSDESIVRADFKSVAQTTGEFQSEAKMEEKLIKDLVAQGYIYLQLGKTQEEQQDKIWDIIRQNINRLNFKDGYTLSNNEWNRLKYQLNLDSQISATELVQDNNKKVFELKMDDDNIKNIIIFDKENLINNNVYVVNQLVNDNNRYDVNILVNGFPLVHIELKRRFSTTNEDSLKQAFSQVNRYHNESFASHKRNNLFNYTQMFVISNGVYTKYFSNTTYKSAIDGKNRAHYRETSFWTDIENRRILEIEDFTKYFLDRRVVLNIIFKYSVLKQPDEHGDRKLLILRPYQIAAVEAIIKRVKLAHINKQAGSDEAKGYIWHTTGSGKTLTSFKTCQLLADLKFDDDLKNNQIYKVVFVVDRRDLNRQTTDEYDKCSGVDLGISNAINSDHLAKILTNEYSSKNNRIVITTINKLNDVIKNYIKSNSSQNNKLKDVAKNKEIVFIFDECQRSTFGSMLANIRQYFKKHYLIGFTGTPIFDNIENPKTKLEVIKQITKVFPGEKISEKDVESDILNIMYKNENKDFSFVKYFEDVALSDSINKNDLSTTINIFKKRLHTYTIIDAVKDNNVVPYKISYHTTFHKKDNIVDKEVTGIDTKSVYYDSHRISNIVDQILEKLPILCHRTQTNKAIKEANLSEQQNEILKPFNAIFATESIEQAILYYREFKRRNHEYKIGMIFSAGNPNDPNQYMEEEFNTKDLRPNQKEALIEAINDYNNLGLSKDGTKTSYSIEEKDKYYSDIQNKVADSKLDLIIVVNMLLTGFDSPSTNTLFVDKPLKSHNLIQAFSRVNRTYPNKMYGNIVSFRNIQDEVNYAIALYGKAKAKEIACLRSYNDYMNGFTDSDGKYQAGFIQTAKDVLNCGLHLPNTDINDISQDEKVSFVKLFNRLLKLRDILVSFDNFLNEEKKYISGRELGNCRVIYNDIYQQWKNKNKITNNEKEQINDDLVFEIQLLKTDDITVEKISQIINDKLSEYMQQIKDPNLASFKENTNFEEYKSEVLRAASSSTLLWSKVDLINRFLDKKHNEIDYNEKINEFENNSNVSDILTEFVQSNNNERIEEFYQMVKKYQFNLKAAYKFLKEAFENDEIKWYGEKFKNIYKPTNMFDTEANNQVREEARDALEQFFNSYNGVTNRIFTISELDDKN